METIYLEINDIEEGEKNRDVKRKDEWTNPVKKREAGVLRITLEKEKAGRLDKEELLLPVMEYKQNKKEKIK